MNMISIKGRLLAVAAVGVLISGCATTEDVEKAQATADSAMAGAHAANQSASVANDAANNAQTGVNQNKAAISEMDPKVDALYAAHKGPRG